jgi:hypothetical protein
VEKMVRVRELIVRIDAPELNRRYPARAAFGL